MCGIIGYTGDAEATPILIAGLRALEYRGYDSAGIALAGGGRLRAIKSVGRIDALAEKAAGADAAGTCGIGHTRWATHGCPTEDNCHPHLSYGGRFAVVHNGIIENCDALRKLCESAGVTPRGDTDSELIAHLLELEYDGDPVAALRRVAARLRGSYALGVLCADFPREIYAAKMRSPLIIGLGDGAACLSSDGGAMPECVNRLAVLADGQEARLTLGCAEVYERGRPVAGEFVRCQSSRVAAGLSGYPHYMLKEMCEQPEAIARTVADECKSSRPALPRAGVTLIGCGSSYHAALACAPLVERVTGCRAEVRLASEYICSERVREHGRHCVLLSQSGETADTIAAAEEAERRGCRTLAIVNVHASTLTRVCDSFLCTRAGPEISVATTKGFTTQVGALARLAADSDPAFARELKSLPFAAEEALAAAEKTAEYAGRFARAKCAFFVGRKTDYGAALEGALKLKEITYVPALGIAAGELKHGSISLIEKGTPVVMICTDPALEDKAVLSAASVRSRGAFVLAVTTCARVAEACDCAVMLPRVHPLLSAAVSVIPLQRLAYETALLLGRDIDKPRNLAKSVTVE